MVLQLILVQNPNLLMGGVHPDQLATHPLGFVKRCLK